MKGFDDCLTMIKNTFNLDKYNPILKREVITMLKLTWENGYQAGLLDYVTTYSPKARFLDPIISVKDKEGYINE